MKRQELPLPYTWLHQLEFRNALRLRVFRREITPAERDASLNAVLADLAAGVLVTTAPPLAEMLTDAERLSALHSEKLATRSLDIVHVACGLVLGLPQFITFDQGCPNVGRPLTWNHLMWLSKPRLRRC